MFRKVLMLLLILLVFMGGPVYASEIYTLEQGKVYVIRLDHLNYPHLDVVFSDNVLYGFDNLAGDYKILTDYDFYGKTCERELDTLDYYMFVYNLSDSNVIMSLNDGVIQSIRGYESPFGIVMFDGSESFLEVTNISDKYRRYRIFNYDDGSGLLSLDRFIHSINSGSTREFEGKGVLIFETGGDEVENILSINGVYEVGNFIRYGFFYKAPWTLVMDFGRILEVFWGQLRMLLPVGLMVLSIFLLIDLIRYTVRLFL